MQNMIQLQRQGKLFNVFFDANRDTHDFENIRVREVGGEPLLVVTRQDMEAIKELIAEEIILATLQLASRFKSGDAVHC